MLQTLIYLWKVWAFLVNMTALLAKRALGFFWHL